MLLGLISATRVYNVPNCACRFCQLLLSDPLLTLLCLQFQNVPPAVLLRFLREHRSEWADNNIDPYLAAAVKIGPCCLPGSRVGGFGNQVILPLAQTIEHEEVIPLGLSTDVMHFILFMFNVLMCWLYLCYQLLEVIKLEGIPQCPEDAMMPRDTILLQVSVIFNHPFPRRICHSM